MRLGIPLLALFVAAPVIRAQDATVVRDTTHRTSIATDYQYANFNGNIQPWQFASVSLGERFTGGSVIGRVNYAHQFGSDGLQYEADAYPRLGANGTYGYFNAGYSSASVFPRWRFGGEVFTNLPDAFETSVGFRQLRFAGSTPVTLFTGSLGKYSGNYWYSLRPYIREKDSGTSASATLTVRRYYEDANHYIGARIGAGSAPSDRLLESELARTSSSSADIHGLNHLGQRVFGSWAIGFEREQLPAGTTRTRWDVTGGLRYDF